MGEIGWYREEVLFTQPFEGNITTRGGQTKHVRSVIGQIGGQEFIISGKGIWIKIRKGKFDNKFNMPISQMWGVEKIREKTKNGGERVCIQYYMKKGLHWSATFGKKDKDGKRMFQPKSSCSNCGNYSKKEKSGYGQQQYRSSGSGRSI